ncbi:MAG TPA: RNB domain-containing ribonuclease, partial [Kiloniellaceae bacterium]|nr:RNB domain-containing ribonuclease [Kiloniellaceae bacterium]
MAKSSKPARPAGRVPGKDEVLAYLKSNPGAFDKRQLARAFKLQGAERVALRDLLREMKRDGLIEDQGRRRVSTPGHLPSVTVLRATALDEDGELQAKPAGAEDDADAPLITLAKGSARTKAPAIGDLVLARLTPQDDGSYRAQVIRILDHQVRRVIGLYEVTAEGGRLRPCDKKARDDYLLGKEQAGGAEPGELVLAEVLPKPRGRHFGLRAVRVVERLGSFASPGAFSLIAIQEYGLPHRFPAAALAEAEAADAAPLKGREDLRALPLVTIDGADARDFDDAVYAAPDDDPANQGGHLVIVAIADVAHYVRPGSALDREARHRGNSAYFPDRVVPMLPEALSNGWCSLVPGEDRSCLGVEMRFDAEGNKRRHRFFRALMRSAARLTYDDVQTIKDRGPEAAKA